jgi:hypothetical protein
MIDNRLDDQFSERVRQMKAVRTSRLFGLVMLFSLLLTGVALADNVVNDADVVSGERTVSAVVDQGVEVEFWFEQRGPSCNVSSTSPATLSYASLPANVSVTPASLQFTACDEAKAFTFTATTTGTYSIPRVNVAGTGSFNTAPSTFQLVVTEPSAPVCPSVPAAPAVTPVGLPDATTGWYNFTSGVAGFTVSPEADAEYSLDGGLTWTSYSAQVNFDSDGVRSVIARNFVPAAGDCARVDGESSSAVEFKVDRTAPTITLTTPVDGASYLLNATVNASYGCADATSGIATCTGTVPDGSAIDTASVGAKSFTVNATDVAGNSATPTTHNYAVGYDFVGFERPVDNGALNVAKAGRAIPLKWRLLDANGEPVTDLSSVRVTVAALACDLGTTQDLVEEYAAGESGLQNLGDGHYQFNWKTPNSYANSCKTLRLDLGEGSVRTAQFRFTR